MYVYSHIYIIINLTVPYPSLPKFHFSNCKLKLNFHAAAAAVAGTHSPFLSSPIIVAATPI